MLGLELKILPARPRSCGQTGLLEAPPGLQEIPKGLRGSWPAMVELEAACFQLRQSRREGRLGGRGGAGQVSSDSWPVSLAGQKTGLELINCELLLSCLTLACTGLACTAPLH